MDWTKAYGNAHEEFPIEKDWAIGENRFRVGDIMNEEDFIWATSQGPDYVYVDPPWNQSNIGSFYTKAGKQKQGPKFHGFINRLIQFLKCVKYDCFVEMGSQNIDEFTALSESAGFTIANIWETTYYRTRPARLVQMSLSQPTVEGLELTGMWDKYIPWQVCEKLPANSLVMDVCTGKGLTALASVSAGHRFAGLELNPRRLAHAVQRVDEIIRTGKSKEERKHGIKQGKHSKRIY